MQETQATRTGPGAKRRRGLRAYLVFTGSGPILIATTFRDVTDPRLVEKLRTKGVMKFIAYEVPLSDVRAIYGETFDVIAADLERADEVRVIDFNGHHIFSRFSFASLGQPVKWGG